MLPGFRFLLAAILLSTSILVFGLGAAALLRATHEQYVSNPSWRNGPQEKVFAQATEPAQPVLAVLRAEPEAATKPTPSLRDQVPTIGLPETEPEQMAALTTETDAQPQIIAPPADAASAEPARAEIKTETKAETTAEAAAPAPTDTLTPADTTASIPEAKPAVAAASSEPAPVDPGAAIDPDPAMAAAALDIATSRLAARNDAAATASKAPPTKAKSDSATPDSKATKRKAKAKKVHRVVRHQPPQQLQQQLDPFGQQTLTATTRTR